MIRKYRKMKKISQKELSFRLDVSQSYISRLENYKVNNVNIELIRSISKELEIDPVEVFLFFYKMNNDKTKD